LGGFKEETRVFTSMADVNGLRNMAHEINAFVKEARDVKLEYHNVNTQANGFVIATVTATIPEQTNQ
jgi:hypothetical protein